MDMRYEERWRYNVVITTFGFYAILLILSSSSSSLISQTYADESHTQTQRRDIASISATQLNRNRNLRQTYDGNALEYREILPSHTIAQYDDEFGMKRNSTDNRKPAFINCKDYAPSVKEEQPPNTYVITVEARDPDEEDTITYSFEKSVSERAKFRINQKTGEIVTSYTFDRDEPIREKEVRTTTCIYLLFGFISKRCKWCHVNCYGMRKKWSLPPIPMAQ